MKSFLFLSALLGYFSLSNCAFAHDFSLGIGNLSEYIRKFQTDDNGTLSLVNFNPYLKAEYDYNLTEKFSFSPVITLMLPKNNGDSKTTHWSFYTTANAQYKLNNFLLSSGLGFYFTRISSDGGTEILNNGTAQTSFPLPDDPVISRNFIFTISGMYKMNPEWSIELNTLIFNLLNNDDRAFSVGINCNYHFGDIFK